MSNNKDNTSNHHPLGYKQVSQVERRRWDTEAYEKKAAERQQRELVSAAAGGATTTTKGRPPDTPNGNNSNNNKPEFQPAPAHAAGPEGSQRAYLQARKGKVGNIDDKVGSMEIISVDGATTTTTTTAIHNQKDDTVQKTGVGWHCTVCDCFLKDSHTYLDHINGRKHQRKLGYSMRVQRSTEADLLTKLSQLQQQQQQQQHDEKDEINYEKLVQDKDEQERLRKEERQRKRKERRKLHKEKDGGSSQEQEEEQQQQQQPQEEEEEEEHANASQGGIDPNLAAIMGFSGFGSTKG